MGKAKVISFISRKGGTGKTTNAIQLATALWAGGHNVVLFETDTNYTLATLRAMEWQRMSDVQKINLTEPFPILASEDHRILDDMDNENQKGFAEYIIIDSAGKTTDANIKRLCLQTNLIVIPTSLSRNDVLVTYQTIEDLKPALGLNKELTIAVLPNRINSQTGKATLNAGFGQLDAHILQTIVPQKNIFTQFSTIFAEDEYAPIAREIIELLLNKDAKHEQ